MATRRTGMMAVMGLLLVAWSGGATATEVTLPPAETLAQQFQAVVFRTEAGAGKSGKPAVKWASPIHAHLKGDLAPTYRKTVESLFKQLHTLTGLAFRLVPSHEPANLEIEFMPTRDIRRESNSPGLFCWGSMGGSKSTGTITHGRVLISIDDDWRTRHCIIEEISQILGLTNDTNVLSPEQTIFNDDSKLTSLPLADQIMIRTLYDRRLAPGTSEEQAMPIARQVIEEMLERLRNAKAIPQ